MRRLTVALAWLVWVGWLAACAPEPSLPRADSGPLSHAVSVFSNGWHTAIIVPRRELVATGLVPEAE
ncbi:MAG: hypothetical protein FJX56_14720, partial [Alphaproteobacteria bacterium]|nr:hypothetical protein [Alphaproteobacteria bacterium]